MTEWIRRRERVQDESGARHSVPGIIRCRCGESVVISHDGVQCPECNQPYNLSGQELRRDHRKYEMMGEAADYLNERSPEDDAYLREHPEE